MSLDTVYRTLAFLEKWGLARRAPTTGERTRYDANTDVHHHFVCTECSMVRDFYSPEMDGLEVPDVVKALGDVTSRHVELRGVCSQCRSRGATRR